MEIKRDLTFLYILYKFVRINFIFIKIEIENYVDE